MLTLSFSTALLFTNCFGTPPENLPTHSREIAKVGEVVIKENLLRLYLSLELIKFPKEYTTEANQTPLFENEILRPILLKTLDQVVEDEVILQYGREKGLLLPENELKKEFLAKKKKWSRKELDLFLKERNLDYNRWKKHVEREIQTNHIVYVALLPTIQVSPQEIKTYYSKNRKKFDIEEQIRIRQIVTDSKDKAMELRERILAGENFAKLALEHSQSPDRSQGGDLGYFSKGDLPQMFDVCFALQKGELSEIVASDYGFHIFKVLDIKPKRRKRFDEVASEIHQMFFAEKQKEQFKKWYKMVKDKTKITINTENLKILTL